jgi:hypothetical protein
LIPVIQAIQARAWPSAGRIPMYKLSPHITSSWEWRRVMTYYQNQRALNATINIANMAIMYAF